MEQPKNERDAEPHAVRHSASPRAAGLQFSTRKMIYDLHLTCTCMCMCMYCDLNATPKNRMRRYALTPLLDEPGGGGSCVRGAFFVRSMREVPH